MAEIMTNTIRKLLPSHPDFKISLFISGFFLTEPISDDHSEGIDKESMTLLTWKSIRVKYKSP